MRTLKTKICTPKKAASVCAKARKSGKRIVFTNGCFDILHPGHVSYLEAARKKGDFLVVALDTDAAVKFLKGPDRPVNPLESRAQVIAALESVDLVTWFGNADPVPTIKMLRPHVLVKGGDWKPAQILGSTDVLGWGGKVFSIKYIQGKSTTNIITKIRKSVETKA